MKKRTLPTWMKHASGEKKTENQTCSSQITDSLPLFQYSGDVIYCYHHGECALLCQDILQSLDGGLVAGMDIEWPVTFKAGQTGKTATIQLCLSHSADRCYIFHIAAMSEFPKMLMTLLSDKRLTKVGVNIEGDIWKLGRDFDFPSQEVIRESTVELSSYANLVLKSSGRWSLDGLTQNLLHQRLDKSADIRLGRWDDVPLSAELQQYAAADACVSLKLYEELKSRSQS